METFGRRITLDLPFDVAVRELRAALAEQRISLLAQSDVHDYLERTVHHDIRRYALLVVAIPEVVLDALRLDLSIGPLLVTTVAVFELADGETEVVVAEPFAGLGSNASWRHACPKLAVLADRSCDQLARALSEMEEAARTCAYIRAAVAPAL